MRVWEPFLTDNDRAHLAVARDRRVGFGQRAALILVDLYRGVFGDEPQPLLEAVKTWPGSCGLAGWQSLPSTQRLLGLARESTLPIVHLTGLDDAGMLGWSEAAHHDAGRGNLTSTQDGLDRRRRRYQIIEEVAPIAGEVVLRKAAPSGFWGTPLAGHLNYLGVDTLLVAGETTSGCVRATVVDGCSYRFRMIVVEECVFDRHESAHALNLFDMHNKYADVLPLDEVETWLRSSEHASARAHNGGPAADGSSLSEVPGR
jgi:nicotinamidase-related amidase